jgi:heavy metal sensor kinase
VSFLRPIRVRLTLWYVLLLAATLGVFVVAVYFALRESLYANLDDSLETRMELVAGLVVDGGGLEVEGAELPADPVEGEEFTRVYDETGEVIADTSAEQAPVHIDSDAVDAALDGEQCFRGEDVGDVSLRVIVSPIRADGEVIGALELGIEDEVGETLNTYLLIVAIAYPLALLVAAAGGVFLAGRALSPIDRVTNVARKISAEDLSQRLDMDLPDDEVGRLARTFDDMIARLDDAFQRQRQFTSDASHELRTPLTSIKGQTEVALQRERTGDEYREVLRLVNAEVDRMGRLVGSLLTLARADSRQLPVERDTLEPGVVVRDAVDQVRDAAAARDMSIALDDGGEVTVTADHDLILQMLLNLLDNAVKYGDEGGQITVGWRTVGDDAELTVSDNGPGISPEDLPHVFDRFYRADKARSRASGGVGLGLSICRWIAEAHGGTIVATSAPGQGTTFTVRLPLR